MGWLFIWFLCGIAASMIATNKGGSGGLWFVVGVLLGPFGVLFAVLDQSGRIQCPACREWVRDDATRCPHCQALYAPPEHKG